MPFFNQFPHLKKTLKYALLFTVYFIISILLLSHLKLSLSEAVAKITLQLVNGFGGNISLQGNHLINQTMDVEINDVCSGVTEMAVILAALMASYDVGIKNRVMGVAAGFAVILVVNPLRIATTILLFEKSAIIGEMFHDILFRISLFVVVLVYYVVWYNMSVKR
jgi:exosortase/archaeosortase family protein